MRLGRFKAARIELAWMCLVWATRMIPYWGNLEFAFSCRLLFLCSLFSQPQPDLRLCRRHAMFFSGSGFYREARREWNSSRSASSDLVISQGLQRLDRKKAKKYPWGHLRLESVDRASSRLLSIRSARDGQTKQMAK
ncbi:hypothetical protein GGI35DRAFT_192055 [Trichoderma velutinum]